MQKVENNKLIEESIKTKRYLIIISALFLASLVSVILLIYKTQVQQNFINTQNEKLERKSDSLNTVLAENLGNQIYIEELLDSINRVYVLPNDPQASVRISSELEKVKSKKSGYNLLASLYSNDEVERKKAVQELIDNNLNDKFILEKLIEIGIANINNPKGTVNTLFLINRFRGSDLKIYYKQVNSFLDLVEEQTGREQAKSIAREIRGKVNE